MKNAWIICHDSYLDHRIFFFERNFRTKGISSKIFGGAYEVGRYFAFDVEGVVRPEIRIPIYDFHNGKKLTEDLDSNELYIFSAYAFSSVLSKLAVNGFTNEEIKGQFERSFLKEFPLGSTCGVAIQNSELYVRYQVFGDPNIFEFSSMTGLLSYIKAIPEQTVSDLHQYQEFINEVYDFTPLFISIESELEKKELPEPDLIYVADLPTLPLAIYYKKKFGVPLILDCHEWWTEQFKIWGNGDLKKLAVFDKFERLYYPEADLRITVGRNLASDMSEYYGIPFHCIFTCDSIGLNKLVTKSQFWANWIKNYQGERICLFQGSMTAMRDLDLIARLTKYLEDGVLLVIAGSGAYLEEFQRILNNEGDRSKVVFLGWQPQSTLVELTNHAHLGIIPYTCQGRSRYYSIGAPNKLFEYMSANLPIVCDYSMVEIGDIVSSNGFGEKTDMRNAKTAGHDISRLVQDETWLNRCAENYRKNGPTYQYEGQSKSFLNKLHELEILVHHDQN